MIKISRLLCLILCLTLVVSGCSFSVSVNSDDTSKNNTHKEEKNDKKVELSLQTTKVDADAGVTIDNNEMYQQLKKRIDANPFLGADNRFSLFTIDLVKTENGQSSLLLIGINRLKSPIKNLVFDFTLGHDEGEYVWESMPIHIPEEEFGPIKVNHAIPIMLPVTEEQIEVYKVITEENQVFNIENLEYEEEK